jgi:general secretion pathway protein D
MISPLYLRKGFSLLLLPLMVILGGGSPLPAQDTGMAPPAGGANMGGGFTNYQNSKVDAILDLYEGLSGMHLVRDANLASIPPITLNGTGLSKAEMLKLIEATLLLNGVALVPLDERDMKVVAIGVQQKNPRSEGVKIYANAADLPSNDEVVSYYMPLSYIGPQEAMGIFMQNAPIHQYGAYVPAPSAQAMILTENANVIRQLIALKELIDVPPARVVNEFVQLNRADAEKTADLLNKLLDLQGGGGAPAGAAPGTGVIVPANLGNQSPLFNEHNLISGPAKIIADTRSNRLFIVTRPVNMPFLRQIISDLDQPDTFIVPQRRSLKYVLAQDILPALEASVAQGKDEEDQIKNTPNSSTSQTSTPPQQNNSQFNNQNNNNNSSVGGGSLSGITASLSAPPENNAPTVVKIGKTRILADNRSNSIIVFGSPDAVARIFAMIDELDHKPLQVYLATVIGELNVTEGFEFGIDILQKFQKVGQGGLASSLITPGTTKSAQVPEPSSLTSALGFPLPTGLTLYGAIGSTLNAYVRALETTNRFKVISRPSVYTTNNKLAVIASGSQIPIPGTTTSGINGSDSSTLVSTSSTQYVNVLLQLNIIPLINADHQVTLKISQTNNSVGTSQVISGNSIPTILTQEISTEVTIPDKSTVVIGGLISDNTTRDTSGVPLLSDIPILGYLFKDTSKNKVRNELIIMIQPTVVETDEDQIAANEKEKQRTILGREAVESATGAAKKEQSILFQNDSSSYIAPSEVKTATTTTSTTTTTVQSSTKSVTAKAVKTKASVPPVNIVPAVSSPAPDVSNGKLPKDEPAKTPSLPSP